MQVPLALTFRDVAKSPNIVELIQAQVDHLHRFCRYITSCRIAVERPQLHQSQGNPYRIRIEVHVPRGHAIVTTREITRTDMHDSLTTVIRDAFHATRRQLERLVRRQHGETKQHPEQEMAAVVTQLFRDKDYGFLQTLDGRDIYFHRNAVVNGDFGRLEIGAGVQYIERAGDKGPQASTVRTVSKPALSY